MELKFVEASVSDILKLGSNRTFMELKLSSIDELSEENKVLIAPLWN